MSAFTSRRTIAARLLVSSALLSASYTAFAQEAPADPIEDEIIVTGIGTARTADELIGNVSAINRDDIVADMSSTLGDTLSKQPGVSTTFFGQGASRPVLRGLGAERVLVLTNGIGVIDASAASPDHQVSADGIDAERIEILRGPAALAYGGQAIGGVVNVIDGLINERPVDGVEGEAYGAFNDVNEGFEYGAKAKFGAGPLVFSFGASGRDFDNYDIPGFAESQRQRALEEAEHEEHEEEGEEHDEEHEEEEQFGSVENSFVETSTLSGGVSFIGDNGFIGISARQTDSLYGLPGHAHEHEHEEEEGEEHDEEEHGEEEEENPFIDLEQTRIDVRGGLGVNFGIWSDLSFSLSHADYKHTEFEAPGEAGTVYESDGVEGRVELEHNVGAHDGAIGFQFTDKELRAFGDEAFITPTATESFGIFGYERYEFANGMSVEGGLRYDNTELTNVIAGSRSFDLISASGGVHKHTDNGVFLGASLSYTQRAPNESELFADGAHLATNQFEVGNTNLSEESGLNLEGTARYEAGRFEIGATMFVTKFNDFIYLAPGVTTFEGQVTDEADGFPVFLYVQEDADFFGGEVTAALDLGKGPLGMDYTAHAGLDWVNGDLDGGGNVPFLPPTTLNVGGTASYGGITLGGDVTFAGDQGEPGAGQLATDGYTRVDLSAAYDFDIGSGVTPSFFVQLRNATDEEIRYASSVLKDVVPAPGRNLRAGLRLTF